MKRICIYCSSSNKVDPVYLEAARALGERCARNDVAIVFGGGSGGLMGRLADGALDHGGEVVGIMPNFMKDVEFHHRRVSHFHFVGTMHERKAKLIENVDAVVALPGGCGTLEELFEVLTLKRLGLFLKPVVIANINGFFDPLLDQLERCVDQNFMDPRHRAMWSVVREVDKIFEAIETATVWGSDAIHFAAGDFKK